ncbi:DUF6263 family protein [Muriicola soli]|uniref:Uncharacterized protein n=1 Tax=Muriicola soli TaxID=2507538 RepID=A0A411EA87_9FLAO|nr:DUF6263 family protein [Muriicola soli]QBA64444.1 hypothetical protein EQY75_07865 [Muriicola soli]
MGAKKLFFLVLFFWIFVFGNAQDKLQYNLKEGDVFRLKQVARQDITQELDGASHEITNDIKGILEFKVTAKLEDTYAIDIVIKDLLMKMTSSMQGVLLDVQASQLDPENVQSRIFHSLLNNPVHIVMRNNGDILEVKGGDSLVAGMVRASGLKEAFAVNMLSSSLKNEFGSEALSDSYKQMTFIYPEKEVIVGDQWENNYSGELNAENLWHLDSLDGDKAIISGKAKVKMKIDEPATSMVLDGTQNTLITTDLKSGFILNMKVEGFSEGYSTLAQMDGQKIPTTISSLVTYELIQ